MSGGGRIPLWIVATVAGLGVITVLGIFFYGAYAGVGSAIQGSTIQKLSKLIKLLYVNNKRMF